MKIEKKELIHSDGTYINSDYVNQLEELLQQARQLIYLAERTMIVNALRKNDLIYFTDQSEKWLDKLP